MSGEITTNLGVDLTLDDLPAPLLLCTIAAIDGLLIAEELPAAVPLGDQLAELALEYIHGPQPDGVAAAATATDVETMRPRDSPANKLATESNCAMARNNVRPSGPPSAQATIAQPGTEISSVT